MPRFKSLEGTSLEILYTAFNEAFRDYGRTWTENEFRKMLLRRGYVAGLSFGMFDGERLVSFTLNGIGIFNRKRTAYDTGTGTIKEYSGQGFASGIFNESIPFLKKAGIRQYLLEVLTVNTKAIHIYEKQGFRVRRELNYFIQDADIVRSSAKILPSELHLKKIDLSHKSEMREMWDCPPSWQNDFPAIEKSPHDFITIGAHFGDKFAGYGIVEPDSGDIPQLAVHKAYRRLGIGAAILKILLGYINHELVRIINVDGRSEVFSSFLSSQDIVKTGSQYEMIHHLA